MNALSPFWLTFKLAFATTSILVIVGLPLSYWMAFSKRRWKYVVEPLVSMPLILPPTVLGFYLLLMLSPGSFLGGFFETYLHVKLVFSFVGLVIGSVLFSLPFMVNPVKSALASFPLSLIEASYTLGKSRCETFVNVILPNIKPALYSGIIMTFAHTVGEFGVVLMIGGSIPGETQTASIAVFNEVEALNYPRAHMYCAFLAFLSFAILFVLGLIQRRQRTVYD